MILGMWLTHCNTATLTDNVCGHPIENREGVENLVNSRHLMKGGLSTATGSNRLASRPALNATPVHAITDPKGPSILSIGIEDVA